MIDLEKKFSNLRSELPYVLGRVYSGKGRYDYRFAMSMFERFAEAHAKGAIFFGPIAVIPQDNRHSLWVIKDLRGGWGFHPIDMEITTDIGVDPTLEVVTKNLQRYANDLRCKADIVERLVSELSE